MHERYALRINLLDVLGLEGRTTDNKCVQDDADRPSVNLEAVPIRSIKQHLGGNIVWRATDSFLSFTGVLDQGSKTEVADLDVHVRVKE